MLDVVSSENREKTIRFVLTFYRQATDRLPTHYQQSADCRPTVGRQVAYISGKTCRPSVGRMSADRRPTVPTVGRQLTDSRPKGFLGSSSSQLPPFRVLDSETILSKLRLFLECHKKTAIVYPEIKCASVS